MTTHRDESLEWSVQDVDGSAPIVSLAGELDMFTADALEHLLTSVGQSDTDVIVDLSDLRFMDSFGLNVFIRARTELERRGRTILLRGPAPMLARVLAVSGADQVVTIEG
jgi:stage II sporulation protein AA (anti-sigma F factor antagonist)